MRKEPGRVVWITGASSGIGKALTESFAGNGDTVIASSRRISALNGMKKELSPKCRIETVRCDVRYENPVSSAVKRIIRRHGKIDVLINNAGVTYFRNFTDTSVKQFDHVVNTNLRGVFLTAKCVLPQMMKYGGGLIINILSYAVKENYTGSAAYTASKAGAEAMMNVLRAEVRESGIKIVNVHPGAVLTGIWSPAQRRRYGKRMILPDQVADTVYEISVRPGELMVEEIVIRPQGGDLAV
jgi:NADP-dependent 3-hydroxy acid dehydrogenase YdfG